MTQRTIKVSLKRNVYTHIKKNSLEYDKEFRSSVQETCKIKTIKLKVLQRKKKKERGVGNFT